MFKYIWLSLIGFCGLIVIAITIVLSIAIFKLFGKHKICKEEIFSTNKTSAINGIIASIKYKVKNRLNQFPYKQIINISTLEYKSDSFAIKTASGNIEISGTDEKKAQATIEVYTGEPDNISADFANNTIEVSSKNICVAI